MEFMVLLIRDMSVPFTVFGLGFFAMCAASYVARQVYRSVRARQQLDRDRALWEHQRQSMKNRLIESKSNREE